jgi:uncharacterized protein involved in exopolysaccharide biosynthesis/Mrp family chromosome partitioning ATPase
MEQSHQPFDLSSARDILTIIFKHKYIILITFLIISAGVTLYAFSLKRVYESQSVLLVKLGREFTSRPEVGGDSGRGFSVPPETIMRAEMSLITSRDLISTVIKNVGQEKIFPSLSKAIPGSISSDDLAILFFQESLSVTNIQGSSMIQISFTHSDPYIAADVVNTLVDALKVKHLEVFSTDSTPFLKSQEKVFQERLKESETKLASLKQKYGVFSFDEQKTALIAQRSTLDTNLKAAQSQVNELEQKVAMIKSPKWVPEVPPEIRAQLIALQQREREVMGKYIDGTVPVQNVRKEIEAVKESLNKQSEEIRQTEIHKAEGELSMARVRADNARRQLGQVEAALQSLEARALELQEAKRDAALQEQNYQTYSKKLEESQVRDDMERQKIVAITVVEKALASSMPKRGRFGKRQLVPMGFFGGIAAGIALAFMLEFMSPGMTTPWSAERRLNLPVLSAIRRLMISSRVPVDVNPTSNPSNSEMDMEQEMIDLYQTITAALPENNNRTVLFVGSRSNEGTSTIARQLARVASLRMEKSVLLIDLDRSRPDLHVYSTLKAKPDIQDGEDQTGLSLTRVEESSLYVMPLFWRTMVTPKTIDYAKRGDFWESLKDQFDLIIVDSPPASMFPDGPAIVSRLDGVILVVEAEKTRWHVALSVKEKILKSGGNILGIVFNKRRLYIPEIIYRYL